MENISAIASSSIGKSLNQAWGSTKANIFLLAGFSFSCFVIAVIMTFIPGLNFVVNLFSFVVTASMFSAYDTYERTGKLEFNDFFGWSSRFGRLFLGNLVLFVIAIAVLIPVMIVLFVIIGMGAMSSLVSSPDPETFIRMYGAQIAVFVLVFFVVMLLLAIWLFAYPFIIQFTDLSYGEALKLSWKIGRNNIGHLILFVLLAIGLSILGFLCLGIGLAVTSALIIGVQFYFLRSMFAAGDTQWDFNKGKELV